MTMAYMDFARSDTIPAVSASRPLFFAPSLAVEPEQPLAIGFEAREWSVVRLAREDGLSSIRPETDLGRVLRLIFGIKRRNPLSSPRLEALRRMAVLSWHHGYNVSSQDIGDFMGAGYSQDQYEELLKHIGAERAASGRRSRR